MAYRVLTFQYRACQQWATKEWMLLGRQREEPPPSLFLCEAHRYSYFLRVYTQKFPTFIFDGFLTHLLYSIPEYLYTGCLPWSICSVDDLHRRASASLISFHPLKRYGRRGWVMLSISILLLRWQAPLPNNNQGAANLGLRSNPRIHQFYLAQDDGPWKMERLRPLHLESPRADSPDLRSATVVD